MLIFLVGFRKSKFCTSPPLLLRPPALLQTLYLTMHSSTVLDLLVRASLNPIIVSISPSFSPSQSLPWITLSRGARILADVPFESLSAEVRDDFDAVICCGGAKGAERLAGSKDLLRLVKRYHFVSLFALRLPSLPPLLASLEADIVNAGWQISWVYRYRISRRQSCRNRSRRSNHLSSYRQRRSRESYVLSSSPAHSLLNEDGAKADLMDGDRL